MRLDCVIWLISGSNFSGVVKDTFAGAILRRTDRTSISTTLWCRFDFGRIRPPPNDPSGCKVLALVSGCLSYRQNLGEGPVRGQIQQGFG